MLLIASESLDQLSGSNKTPLCSIAFKGLQPKQRWHAANSPQIFTDMIYS